MRTGRLPPAPDVCGDIRRPRREWPIRRCLSRRQSPAARAWAAPALDKLTLPGSLRERASESRNPLLRSCFSPQPAFDRFENVLDSNRQHRARWKFSALISSFFRRRFPDHNVTRRIRAVASGVSGAIKSSDGRSQCGCHVQRAGIRRDEEFRASQKRNKLSQVELLDQWFRRSRLATHNFREILLAGAETDHASAAISLRQRMMQRSIPFRGPAFGTPAAARRQHKIFTDAFRAQDAFHFVSRSRICWQGERYLVCSRAEALHQFEIMLHFVLAARRHTLRIEERGPAFASVLRIESNPPWSARKPS